MEARAKSILVVDDDPDIRRALTEILNEEGYSSVSACNGVEALSLLRSGRSMALVVLDLMMPVMDGYAFLLERRRDATLAHIPIIAITADANCGQHKLDVAAVVKKPFSLTHLFSKIEACLASAPPAG
jgi:CheY-like chemotaxis protein